MEQSDLNMASLKQRVASLSDSPFYALLQDQLVLLQRATDDLATGPRQDDSMRAFEMELTAWEQQHLAANIAAWMDVLERNRQIDAAGPHAVFNVRDFGAKGDGQQDDAPAIRAAVLAANAAGKRAVVRIPAGRYRLVPLAGERAHLYLHDLKDISIEGEAGTELIGIEPISVLSIEYCRNVRLYRFSMDYDPHPYTQGRILSVNPERTSLEWQVDPGFIGPDAPALACYEELGGCTVDLQSGRLPPHSHDSFATSRWENLGGGRYRLYARPGSVFREDTLTGKGLFLYKRLGPMAFEIRACDWIDCEEVIVNAAPQFAAYFETSTGITLRRCALEPKAGRHSGLNADGYHCRSLRFGPMFEDCRIIRVTDDCFNLYSRGAALDAVLEDGSVVIAVPWEHADRQWAQHPRREDFVPGDLLAFMDPETGDVQHAKITAVRPHVWHRQKNLAITLDRPVSGLRSGESLGRTTAARAVFLEERVATRLETFVVNVSTKCDGFVIRGCELGDNTVTGGKIKASNGLIAENRTFHHGWCSFSFATELEWLEGFAGRRVLVRDNRFESWFGLFVNEGLPGGRINHKTSLVRRIDIVNNTFSGIAPRELCIDFRNGVDCTVIGNQLSATRPIALSARARHIRFEDNKVLGA